MPPAADQPPPHECADQCAAQGCGKRPSATLPARPPPNTYYGRTLPPALVDFSSPEGRARLSSALAAGTANAFFPLVAQMQTQPFPAACGLTTLTILLNALRVDPGRVWHTPWRWYDEGFLFCCSGEDQVRRKGVTVDELACVAECNGLRADVLRGASDDDARALVIKHVSVDVSKSDGENVGFLVASFSRRGLGQTGGGHFSPLAAYDRASDSVLVLDTARFKYPPFWVPVADLNAATLERDPETSLPRGFVVVCRRGGASSAPPIVTAASSLRTLNAALKERSGTAWSAESLVAVVQDSVGLDAMSTFTRRPECLFLSDAESCPGLADALVCKHAPGTGGTFRERRALPVLGLLATSAEHGLHTENVAVAAFGRPWGSVPRDVKEAVSRVSAALLRAIDGIEVSSGE
jgi:glutathione gamma-glutamylcysteinyltransferase